MTEIKVDSNLVAFKQVLRKLDVVDLPDGESCQFVFIKDASGSMEKLYLNGSVAKVTELLLSASKFFDKDGSMETLAFNTGATKVNRITTEDDPVKFIKEYYFDIVNGGTLFTPPINQIINYFNSLTKNGVKYNDTTVVFFLTDGDNDPSNTRNDKVETRKALKNLFTQFPNVYVNFIRLGSDALKATFIEEVADEMDEVGYANFPELHTTPEAFYQQLLCKTDKNHNPLVNEESEMIGFIRKQLKIEKK